MTAAAVVRPARVARTLPVHQAAKAPLVRTARSVDHRPCQLWERSREWHEMWQQAEGTTEVAGSLLILSMPAYPPEETVFSGGAAPSPIYPLSQNVVPSVSMPISSVTVP